MMRSALTRLRLAFAALGVVILFASFGLLRSAISRLEAQRTLRHRMVAERVFDEAEREVSAVLQHEAERPGTAYDVVDTDPSRWGRFIVGYYRRVPHLHVVAEEKLRPARRTRIREAVLRARPTLDAMFGKRVEPAEGAAFAPHGVQDDASELVATRSPDVLRQLNRGVKVRESRQHALAQSFIVARADADLLVMERAGEGRREGFVLSMSALVSTMQSWVLSAQGLDSVATLAAVQTPRAAHAAPTVRESGVGYSFSHRLAPPLDSQQISLQLSQLDDEDASSALYGLAALFAATAALGLFAIYRMVAVQLKFAERRSNFVSAVTHELRTPLAAIRMYGEMLRDGMVQDEKSRREYYATITAEGERLTRLINNVMEHAKLRRGQRRAHLEHADATSVVRDVVELMTPHIEREGFTVRVLTLRELPPVRVDADALKQVLFNVIDNALKYGRRGDGAQIDLTCEAEGSGVAILVRDYGPGMADDQITHAFEPFFRAENELTRRQKGTGIGLTLVRDLVGLMHGCVRVSNRRPGFEVRISLRGAQT